MPKLFNWSAMTFLVTLASVAVPVWLWVADQNGKSLSFQIASQVPLTVETASSLKGLEVLMDGIKIRSPILTVITLTNDGKKPLPATDFEIPLELNLRDSATVVRAEVTSTKPKDVEAKITWTKSQVKFVPVLLNADESITVSILTEGKKPVFDPRARVIGVSTVGFIDSTTRGPAWKRSIPFLLAALLFFTVADIVGIEFVGGPKVVYLRKRAAIFQKMVCTLGGIVLLVEFMKLNEFDGFLSLMLVMTIALIASGALGWVINFNAKSIAHTENAP